MKKVLSISIVLVFVICSWRIFSQTHAIVDYRYSFNGKEMSEMPKLRLNFMDNIAVISQLTRSNSKVEELSWLNYTERRSYQSAKFQDGRRITAVTAFDEYPKPELTEEYETILGYKCRKANVEIRSNKIEIWFIENSELKGTPLLNQGTELGLVLKIIRNSNFVIEADRIDTVSIIGQNLPEVAGEIIDMPTFREQIIESKFTTVQVFTDERVNYDKTITDVDVNRDNITIRCSYGTVILKRVTLPENMPDHTIIAELSTYSDGDAYDRTGSLFVIPIEKKTSFLDALTGGINKLPTYRGKNGKYFHGIALNNDYSPPIEIMRFITPFGIKKFNEQVVIKGIKWEDSVTYKQDVTDLAAVLQGNVWLGVFIGNYDEGGHIVSLKLKYYPNDPDALQSKQKRFWVQPIINTVNIMEMSGQEYGTMFETDTLTATVDIPEGLKWLKLKYISTGHGGWDGGDEFNPKQNEIFLDGKKYYSYTPWRSDCGMFRKFNPASGNFSNGMSSSDFSRSGWCPGSISIPVDLPLTGLRPGKHSIGVYIPIGKPEGSSFSSWNVSALLIGEYND